MAGDHLLVGQPDRTASLAGVHVRVRHRARDRSARGRPRRLRRRPASARPTQPPPPSPPRPPAAAAAAAAADGPGARPDRLRDRGIHRPGHADQLRGGPAQRGRQRPGAAGRDDRVHRGRGGRQVLQQVSRPLVVR